MCLSVNHQCYQKQTNSNWKQRVSFFCLHARRHDLNFSKMYNKNKRCHPYVDYLILFILYSEYLLLFVAKKTKTAIVLLFIFITQALNKQTKLSSFCFWGLFVCLYGRERRANRYRNITSKFAFCLLAAYCSN